MSSQCMTDKLKESMVACDSLVDIAQIKCDSKACHSALHTLVREDYVECYVQLGVGPAEDLAKYKALDDFCHGEGPDPYDETAAATPLPAIGSSSAAGSGSVGKSPEDIKDDAVSVASSPSTPTAATSTRSPTLSSTATSKVIALSVTLSAFVVSVAVGL
ncbi:hypothetical protein FI667_g13365, partial [Globisporangium splendens]